MIWVFFSVLNRFLSITDGYMKFVFGKQSVENKFVFVCFTPASHVHRSKLKKCQKMTTFQNDGGGDDFCPIFSKSFLFMKQMPYIHPPKCLVTISLLFDDIFNF